MKKAFAAAVLFAAMVCTSALAEPTAVIVGQDEAVQGELVMLKTTGSKGGMLYRWESFPKSTKHFFFPVLLPIGVDADGRVEWEHAAIFSSLLQGRFAIVLAVAEGDQPALCIHEIAVGDDPGPDPPDPDPPIPPDPPDPNQKWQVVIVYETNDLDNMPQAQQVMLASLTFRKRLKDEGHSLVAGGIVDQHIKDKAGNPPAALVAYLEACSGKPLPRICLSSLNGGKVESYPLPASSEEVFKFLDDPRSYRWSTIILREYRSRRQVLAPRNKWIDGGAGMKVRVPINWRPQVQRALGRPLGGCGNPGCAMCYGGR